MFKSLKKFKCSIIQEFEEVKLFKEVQMLAKHSNNRTIEHSNNGTLGHSNNGTFKQ